MTFICYIVNNRLNIMSIVLTFQVSSCIMSTMEINRKSICALFDAALGDKKDALLLALLNKLEDNAPENNCMLCFSEDAEAEDVKQGVSLVFSMMNERQQILLYRRVKESQSANGYVQFDRSRLNIHTFRKMVEKPGFGQCLDGNPKQFIGLMKESLVDTELSFNDRLSENLWSIYMYSAGADLEAR